MRHHFLRRVGIILALFFVLVFAASALAVVVLSGAMNVRGSSGLLLAAAILGAGLLTAGFVAVARSVRRIAAPVADVMDAAERIANGHYESRVRVRGPREMHRLAGSFNEMAERLESGERRRRDLLADVAHELRTPLSVIRGNVEAVLDGVYPPDEAHLGTALEETVVMSRLLDDLQTLSTAEAGVLRLHREVVDPAALVEDAVLAFGARADAGDVSLEMRAAPSSQAIDVDPVRIGEVLGNLVSNALRHAPPGSSVIVSAEALAADAAFQFSVSDAGPGIPVEELPQIFDRFVKSADSGGSGLGLAISKRLVEAHGGRISASSDPDHGTTISFTLPGSSGPGLGRDLS